MKDMQNGKTRRSFLKGTAAIAVPLILTSRKSETQRIPPPFPPSPPTTPWQEALPTAVTPLQSVSSLDPLLNGGPTWFYEFYLANSGGATSYAFTYITHDGNLLLAPLVNQFKVRLGVAERADVVVDFARFPLGTQLYLVNRLEQPDHRGSIKVQAPGTRVLKILVDCNPPEPDVSRVPSTLRPLRQIVA